MTSKYFAYGSNMLSARLLDRVPSAEFFCTGTLLGYVLRFHKVSRDGSGKANAYFTGERDDRVPGVVWEIGDPEEIEILDWFEGVGCGYQKEQVHVETKGEELLLLTYIAEADKVDNGLPPYNWYKKLTLAGAIEHQLPLDHIKRIDDVITQADPDEERRILNSSLISGDLDSRIARILRQIRCAAD